MIIHLKSMFCLNPRNLGMISGIILTRGLVLNWNSNMIMSRFDNTSIGAPAKCVTICKRQTASWRIREERWNNNSGRSELSAHSWFQSRAEFPHFSPVYTRPGTFLAEDGEWALEGPETIWRVPGHHPATCVIKVTFDQVKSRRWHLNSRDFPCQQMTVAPWFQLSNWVSSLHSRASYWGLSTPNLSLTLLGVCAITHSYSPNAQ